jgi:hypothetical protein
MPSASSTTQSRFTVSLVAKKVFMFLLGRPLGGWLLFSRPMNRTTSGAKEARF